MKISSLLTPLLAFLATRGACPPLPTQNSHPICPADLKTQQLAFPIFADFCPNPEYSIKVSLPEKIVLLQATESLDYQVLSKSGNSLLTDTNFEDQSHSYYETLQSVVNMVGLFFGYSLFSFYAFYMGKFQIDSVCRHLYNSVNVIDKYNRQFDIKDVKALSQLRTLSSYNFYQDIISNLVKNNIVRGDLVIYEDPEQIGGESIGLNIRMLCKHPVIKLEPNFSRHSPDAAGFAALHEVGHIVHNDHLRGSLLISIGALAVVYITSIGLNYLEYDMGLLSMTILHIFSFALLTARVGQAIEYRADAFAIKHGTKFHLQGGKRLFSSFIKQDRENNKGKSRFRIAFENFFFSHPTPQKRLEKIERALAAIK
jgi:hypothetical protein